MSYAEKRAEFERETGRCGDCHEGHALIDIYTGDLVKADQRTYGARWEICPRCKGTGKATRKPHYRLHVTPEGLWWVQKLAPEMDSWRGHPSPQDAIRCVGILDSLSERA